MEFDEFINKTENNFENFLDVGLMQCVYLRVTLSMDRELTIKEKKEIFDEIKDMYFSDWTSEAIREEEDGIFEVIRKELSFSDEINDDW